MRRTDDRRLLNDPARENAVFEKIVVFRDDRERARQFNLQKPIDDRTRNLKIVARRERVFEPRGKALAAFRAFRGPVLRFKERDSFASLLEGARSLATITGRRTGMKVSRRSDVGGVKSPSKSL